MVQPLVLQPRNSQNLFVRLVSWRDPEASGYQGAQALTTVSDMTLPSGPTARDASFTVTIVPALADEEQVYKHEDVKELYIEDKKPIKMLN